MTLLTPSQADDLRAAFHRSGYDQLPDAELVALVARTIAVPRVDPADSFVLHAPLELTARAALLPFVEPARRDEARLRLFSLADGYESWGAPVRSPDARQFASIEGAARRLAAAVDRGDLEVIDVAAQWLGRVASPEELRALLTDLVLPRLAAAAHAPIFLWHLPRVAPRREVTGEMLRVLARELGRAPEWRLHWIDGRRPRAGADPDELFEALAAPPGRGSDGPTPFIFPLMSAVDGDGTARDLLDPVTGGTDVRARGQAVLRAAAWSMLLESDEHAPYGWSHCLTMPQAVVGIAGYASDPSRALAIAATYVVGFRAALSRNPLSPQVPLAAPDEPWRDAMQALPEIAAAAVWHAPEEELAAITIDLATRASVQHDAHLVKYTLACLDAAADDPGEVRLFLAAAASLVAWWSGVADPDDPLA